MAAFTLPQWNRGVKTEAAWPAKPETFTIWPFTEKDVPIPAR